MRSKFMPWLAVFSLFLLIQPVQAWHTEGKVWCDVNVNGVIDELDTPVVGAKVIVTDPDGNLIASRTTDANGFFIIWLPDVDGSYVEMLDPSTLPQDSNYLIPAATVYTFSLIGNDYVFKGDWLVNSPECQVGACWMTGGGVKFDPVVKADLAEAGPADTLGGNVFPSCSPDPGDGGQWNHVAHSLKLHFQGWTIETVRCGNVMGIPPGSETPVTPFNFIEFWGTGTLKGIKGNKVDLGDVLFFGRVEDRNEPGSKGAKEGALVDRYYLQVFTDAADPAGSTVFLIDQDGDPTTLDPILITGGNLQLHVSSCDDPPQP